MQPAEHSAILRKTGWVLIAVGVIDIAMMIYTVSQGMSYSSSLNIFSAVAGFYLLRGSLVAASAVRWFAVFLLSAACSLLVIWPFMQPIGLTVTQIRLNPLLATGAATFTLTLLAFLFWTQRQLGLPAVLAAQVAAHRRVRSLRLPVALGTGLVVLLAFIVPFVLGGSSGARAKLLAELQLGSSYQYHLSSLHYSSGSQGTAYRATVTAWNDQEIRTVPVQWSE
jgi:hypothetical protein